MAKEFQYKVSKEANIPFFNNVDYCVGTGRMDLALQKEYFDELELVQSEIGFSYIRGHGLFCDQMAIYHEYQEENGNTKAEYNFTYLDLVMDNYKKLGIKPFLELGFMPSKLASGTQTIFYWKGNTTPPKAYSGWCDLVAATLTHLSERYGKEEVLSWPIEVWNEPNLRGFWENADMDEYFKLFENTFKTIKNLDERFKVGGPAVCGGSDEIWIKAFMEFCNNKKLKIDFVTRHHYTTELPERDGHYGYPELSLPDGGFDNLKTTRDIIDSFPDYFGLPIHITEFNTSYIPNCPLHDTNLNASYLAYQLSRLGEVNESYSYWTFGDVFEEQGIPFTLFHGGFGLVAQRCIPKPTFWTFKFFKDIKNGKCVLKEKNAVIVKMSNNVYRGVLWNLCMNKEDENDLSVSLSVPAEKDSTFAVITKTVDSDCCNPLRVWHDLGEPSNIDDETIKLLKNAANPSVNSFQTVSDVELNLKFNLKKNAVVYFEVKSISKNSDRGFSYNRVMQMFG